MPQLNPAPWFMILVFSWLIFLTVILNKLLKHAYTNEITTLNTEKLKTNDWNWLWH